MPVKSVDSPEMSDADWSALAHIPPQLRPCKIVYFCARRLIQEKLVPDWGSAIKRLADEMGLPPSRVGEICNGVAPTSYEIDRICERKNWSIFFIFAVKDETLKLRRAQYFTKLGVTNPSKRLLKEFDELYGRLLKLQAPTNRKEDR